MELEIAIPIAQALTTIIVGFILYRKLRTKLRQLRAETRAKVQELKNPLENRKTRASVLASSELSPLPSFKSPTSLANTTTIDRQASLLVLTVDGKSKELPLFSKEAFEAVSDHWIRIGWALGYWHSLTWMGRPILALPDDLIRMQEVVFTLQPDYIVETGVAYGGSLIFYASLFEAIGKGRIIGIDIKILPEDRLAIESHPLFKRIEVIEASSIDPAVVKDVKGRIPNGAKVLVVLDSDHSKSHVAAELDAYHDLVTPGSYIVATDGIISLMHDVPSGDRDWIWDNATEAAKDFVAVHLEFVIEQPAWPFNRSAGLNRNVTHWPGAWLKRLPERPPA